MNRIRSYAIAPLLGVAILLRVGCPRQRGQQGGRHRRRHKILVLGNTSTIAPYPCWHFSARSLSDGSGNLLLLSSWCFLSSTTIRTVQTGEGFQGPGIRGLAVVFDLPLEPLHEGLGLILRHPIIPQHAR